MALWQVGPTRPTYTSPKVFFGVEPGSPFSSTGGPASAGDIVEIDPGPASGGRYTGTDGWAWITTPNLTIRGVHGRPAMDNVGNGNSTFGSKAPWIVRTTANGVVIENIEIMNAVGTAGGSLDNLACVRQENQGLLTCRYCYFHDCDNGILTDNVTSQHLVLEYCELAHNCTHGQVHNVYAGTIGSLTMIGCWSHNALFPPPTESGTGHLVKSRALTTTVKYCRLTGETGGESRCLDMPNGGIAYIIGNVMQKSANTDGSDIVSFGVEGLNLPQNELYLVNNTLINDSNATKRHVAIGGVPTVIALRNNIFAGGGTRIVGGGTPTVDTGNVEVADTSGFRNPANYSYRLKAGHAAINAGSPPGTANGVDLTPIREYEHQAWITTRPTTPTLTAGAFAYATFLGATWAQVASSTPTLPSYTNPGGSDNGPVDLYSYGSLAYDRKRNRLVVPLGGGHSATGYNGSAHYDITANTWAFPNSPSPFGAGGSGTLTGIPGGGLPQNAANYGNGISYTDGRPVARHTYAGQTYMPIVDQVLIPGCYAYWNDGGPTGSSAWWYDAAGTFERKADPSNDTSRPNAAVYHDGAVYVVTSMSGSQEGLGALLKYVPTTDTWTTLAVDRAWLSGQQGNIAVDGSRNQLLYVGIPSAPDGLKVQRFNLSDGTGGGITTTGAVPFASLIGQNSTLRYDPVADKFLWWIQELGATIYLLDPVTLIWTTLTTTGSVPPTSPSGTSGLGDGRFSSNRVQRVNTTEYVYHPWMNAGVYTLTPSWVSASESAPSVFSVTPIQGLRGQSLTATITGANFVSGATVDFGTGISITSTTFVSSTRLDVGISIAGDAPTGSHVVTVTNPDLQSGIGSFTVTVTPAPPISVVHFQPTAGIDHVGQGGQLTGNGNPDIHLIINGAQTSPAVSKIRATGQGTDAWEWPYNGLNWVVGFDQNGSVIDAYMEPNVSPGPFIVTVTYTDGSQSTATSTAGAQIPTGLSLSVR